MIELKKITQLHWRKFLATEAGIEGMLFLRERTPRIPKGQPHEVQFDAGRVTGYVESLETITDLIGVEPTKEQNLENP